MFIWRFDRFKGVPYTLQAAAVTIWFSFEDVLVHQAVGDNGLILVYGIRYWNCFHFKEFEGIEVGAPTIGGYYDVVNGEGHKVVE